MADIQVQNVIKRFVILQDEGLVLAELKRARTVAAEHAASAAQPVVPAVPSVAAPPPPPPPVVTLPPPPAPVTTDAAENDAAEDASPEPLPPNGSVSLPELAREAAMKAERAAIQQALDRFRWNRRKAADALGVSYKTLLNKMKECGISEQQA